MSNLKKLLIVGVAAVVAFTLVLTATAATYTNTTGGTAGFAYSSAARSYVLEQELDFSDYPVTTNDVVQLFSLDAPCYVSQVAYSVTTISTTNAATTQTVDIGDGSDTDGYKSGLSTLALADPNASSFAIGSITVTGNAPYAVSATGYTAGKFYNANDTIDTLANGVITDGVMKVYIWVTDFN